MNRCSATLAFLALLAPARPLAGQIQVTGMRDLNFGAVVRGVQTSVLPTDPIKSGRFYLFYVAGGRIQLRMTLPTVLNRVGGGGTMPVDFKNGDAFIQGTAPGSPPNSINPVANTNFDFGANPDANLWLGGRVLPSGTQAAGAYKGTVVLTVNVF